MLVLEEQGGLLQVAALHLLVLPRDQQEVAQVDPGSQNSCRRQLGPSRLQEETSEMKQNLYFFQNVEDIQTRMAAKVSEMKYLPVAASC